MTSKKTNKLFGEKIREVFELMENTPDWEKYVTEKTANVVKYLKESQSMIDTEKKFSMKYITVRSHVLRAGERIKSRDSEFKHEGKSKLAKELFELMDTVENWEQYVTPYEAELAKKFKEVCNFYKLSTLLGMDKIVLDKNGKEKIISGAGNIAGTLYGTTQKIGVIGKIKERRLQADRRDYTILGENETLDDRIQEK
jgi:hypothetical protein